MHALLHQWEVWKRQYAGMQMIANDFYYHNLDLQTKQRLALFKKMRRHQFV